MNKSKSKVILPIVILLALILVFFFVYRSFKPSAQEGSKAYTITVTNDDGESISYEERSDAETLHEAMDILAEKGEFTYEAEDGEYGAFVNSINGVVADFNVDGAYWAIYVNGEYGQYGIDEQPVNDGEEYSFVYERPQ